MKKLILSLFLSCFTLAVFAQEIPAYSVEKVNQVYGFAGPVAEIAVDPHAGIAIGGMGGVAIGDFLFGGFGMTGFFNEISLQKFSYEKSVNYGGVFAGYTLFSHEEAHLFTNLRLGRGTAKLDNKGNKSLNISDKIYVINPEIGLEINVSPWSRFIISGSFRWVDGIDSSTGLSNADFENYAVGMTFRFGNFGK